MAIACTGAACSSSDPAAVEPAGTGGGAGAGGGAGGADAAAEAVPESGPDAVGPEAPEDAAQEPGSEASPLDAAAESTSDGDAAGDVPAGPPKVGSACTSDSTCPAGGSGKPVCLLAWPDGYCAIEGCAQHGHDCPQDPGQGGTATTGSKCVLAPTARCLALCSTTADCRDGYVCQAEPDAAGHGSAKVCVPKAGVAKLVRASLMTRQG
jgi:hypothetical protein